MNPKTGVEVDVALKPFQQPSSLQLKVDRVPNTVAALAALATPNPPWQEAPQALPAPLDAEIVDDDER
jgi:hypothetical protein